MEEPMTDHQIVEAWYRYAAGAAGFIGGALRAQRERAFLTQEQQRAMIGILDRKYDHLWLRLQAMPLPRVAQFSTDLERIVAKVEGDLGTEATVDGEALEKLIRAGMDG